MQLVRLSVIGVLALGLAAEPPVFQDPVLKARAARAAAQGIPERDLPPVTQGLVEPPPLAPPEVHVKDTPGYRKSRRVRRAKTRSKVSRSKTARRTTRKPAPKKAPRR